MEVSSPYAKMVERYHYLMAKMQLLLRISVAALFVLTAALALWNYLATDDIDTGSLQKRNGTIEELDQVLQRLEALELQLKDQSRQEAILKRQEEFLKRQEQILSLMQQQIGQPDNTLGMLQVDNTVSSTMANETVIVQGDLPKETSLPILDG